MGFLDYMNIGIGHPTIIQMLLYFQLPSQCLYLCDHQIRPSNLMPLICLDYVIAAEVSVTKGVMRRCIFGHKE
jgi:hypothetical protein